jgi:hypothetical protein
MNKILQIVKFVPRKIYNYTSSINQALEAPLALGNKWTTFEKWVTKVFGSTSSGALFGKGASDAVIAYACNDGVCFIVSCFGCGFDALQFLASFVPGPNFIVVITLPGSVACKMFVWGCKNQKLPWKTTCG